MGRSRSWFDKGEFAMCDMLWCFRDDVVNWVDVCDGYVWRVIGWLE